MKYKPFNSYVAKAYPQGSITQFMGENVELYKSLCSGGVCLTGGHNGIDMVAPWGTPIFSVDDGEVVEVKDSPTGYGKHVRILCKEDDIYAEWTYGHLSRIDVKVGQTVKGGEQIGLMGNTGFVVSGPTPYWKYNPYAGTHLHLGKRLFKPWDGSGTYNLSYGRFKGTILGYPGAFMGSVPYNIFPGNKDDKQFNSIVMTFISILNQMKSLL